MPMNNSFKINLIMKLSVRSAFVLSIICPLLIPNTLNTNTKQHLSVSCTKFYVWIQFDFFLFECNIYFNYNDKIDFSCRNMIKNGSEFYVT